MSPGASCCVSGRYFSEMRDYKSDDGQPPTMGKRERKELVLTFLSETRLALPPKVIFRNLRLKHNATFSEKSLNNYLSELEAQDFITRVDPEALEQRTVSDVGPDDRGYYLITESGLDEAGSDDPRLVGE